MSWHIIIIIVSKDNFNFVNQHLDPNHLKNICNFITIIESASLYAHFFSYIEIHYTVGSLLSL